VPWLLHRIHPSLRIYVTFCKKLVFYGEELLACCPTPNLEDHPLSDICDCISIYLQLLSISGGCLLHMQPKDTPCCGDRDPYNTVVLQSVSSRSVIYSHALWFSLFPNLSTRMLHFQDRICWLGYLKALNIVLHHGRKKVLQGEKHDFVRILNTVVTWLLN